MTVEVLDASFQVSSIEHDFVCIATGEVRFMSIQLFYFFPLLSALQNVHLVLSMGYKNVSYRTC